jgi:hypothetical protein
MTTKRARRDPYTRTLVHLPERDLAECILALASPVLEALGPTPAADAARQSIELAIEVWNAHVRASKLWGTPRPKALTELRKRVRSKQAPPGLAETFEQLSARWREEFAFDPRLVDRWSFDATPPGLTCETALPEGVEALVPPPLETRVRIGGKFLDEVGIPLQANRTLSFPVAAHRGELAGDGVVTIQTKMATAVELFAEGLLLPIGGTTVDVLVAGKAVGPMVLTAVRCVDAMGRDDVVLTLRPPGPETSSRAWPRRS